MFLSDQGCLLRKAESGENHLLLVLFLKENGLRNVLARKPARPGWTGQLPDLFETGEFCLQQKDPSRPAFLREYQPSLRFPDIGSRYERLNAASRLARFYERNLLHLEHFQPAWELLLTALAGIAGKSAPETVLLKALYVFARSEGYPVRADWLENLPAATRARILEVLRQPVGAVPADPADTRDWTSNLCRYFAQSTDLLPPDL